MKTGFIGLGAMGAPMAGHLAAQGLRAVIDNRTRNKADALAAQLGVRAAATHADFAGCDVVVLCVSMDADVMQQATALAAVLAPGSTVVDHSTVSVGTARRAQALQGRLHPTGRPDVDNVAKLVLDALNGLYWRDDAQIVEMAASKAYGLTPGLQITVGVRSEDAQ
jgi:predicted dinucleotide-binding enzyme